MSQFVHLGIHSEFSITDSLIRIPDLIKAARHDRMPALALTDLSNLHAAVKFYEACLKAGIKPIFGSDLRLDDTDHRVSVLAMSNTGWRNLTELVSRGFTEGLQQDIPIVQKDWVLEQHTDLIVLLGINSDVGQALLSSNPQKADALLQEWMDVMGNRVYLALTRTGRPQEEHFIDQAVACSQRLGIGLVAHNDVRFIQQDDFEAHEARVCIAEGYVLGDERRPRVYSDQQYFRTSDEMNQLFADLPEAIANSGYIAQRCSVTLTLGKNFLPRFPVPDGFTIDTYFAHVSREGLEERLALLYPPDQRGDDWAKQRQVYDERLQFEIDVILKMGFPGYFLIVMDFINWAKNNGVPVGPGRGSGAGSLVAYSLKITDLDPLRYELLFERFLNPERVSMPDFDIDFCIAGRDRVIDYVSRHYGREAVAQIATFGTMAAKGAIRDVARVLGKSYGLADRISKLVPTKPLGVDLRTALEMEPQLRAIVTDSSHPDHEDGAEIWEMALKLEGLTRNTGKHAGGVLISPGKITDFSAVSCDADGNGRVSQFDKDDVEAVGLVKFDFLGLRNLTVIEDAVTQINRRRPPSDKLDMSRIALDDPRAYQVFSEANTTAVFQFESVGMKRMLKEAKPTQFEEIIAFVSLYRPGPMDLIPDFIQRMHGAKYDYLHPTLEHILKPTYGIMVYQEQVMQTAQVCAGYSLGGADLLRRAMGKKKPEEMIKQREIFITGAAEKNIDADTANRIFDYMEKFAGYGFNKSHAAAYALVAYQTAWLKAHYPAEFLAAVLTSEMQNTDNVVFLIDDCRQNGITVLPPSVNQSDFRFVTRDERTIIYGLGAIKGVGEQAMQSVIEARQRDGEFRDLFDFCHRIDLKKINKRTLEALIRAGALDCLSDNRAALLAELPEAVQAAEQAQDNQATGIMDLFGEVAEVQRKPMQPIKPWSDEVRLKGEKDTLGLYLTGHPINVYHSELSQFVPQKLNQLTPTRRGVTTLFAGLVVDVAHFPNRSLIVLDDGTARLELSTSRERFERVRDVIQPDRIVVIEGEIYEREGAERPMARLQNAFSLDDIRQKRAQLITLRLHQQDLGDQLVADLQRCITPFRVNPQSGQRAIVFQLHVDTGFAQSVFQLGEQYLLYPQDDLLRALRDTFGQDRLHVQYHVRPQSNVREAAHRLAAAHPARAARMDDWSAMDIPNDDPFDSDEFIHMDQHDSSGLQEPADFAMAFQSESQWPN